VDEFNTCLYHSGIEDLRFSGCHLTWSNRQQPPNHISSKIDRVLVNEDWLKAYPYSSAFFPTPGISDHSPAVVYITPLPKSAPKPFRFFDFLADHLLFLPTVQRVWRNFVLGNPMYCVYERLRLLQVELKKRNNKEFSDISDRVIKTKTHLGNLQLELSNNPSPAIQSEERAVFKKFLTLSRAEESFARQKSRIQWLKLGDQCTSFFFKSVSNNRNRSKITSLVLDGSTITHDMVVIKDTFVTYYSNLLGKPHTSNYDGSERVSQLITKD
jgi:hypothetical protein